MKYNININQKAVIDNGWDLDINHLALLDCISAIVNSNKTVSISDLNGVWYWVKITYILEQLPLLKIKERRCKDLLADLENCGLIEINPNNKNLKAHYIRLGKNFHFYNFSDSKINYAENCIVTAKDAENDENNAITMQNTAQLTMQNIAEYNNINNNNINNNNINNKKIYKKNPIEERQKKFYDECAAYVGEFGKEIVREFYDYWSEENSDKTKFKKEFQKTFNVKSRLNTWKKNKDKFTPSPQIKKNENENFVENFFAKRTRA